LQLQYTRFQTLNFYIFFCQPIPCVYKQFVVYSTKNSMKFDERNLKHIFKIDNKQTNETKRRDTYREDSVCYIIQQKR
ncbi:hypothetical protein DERP_001688, partial [Dermatophagoides pteronyssinus]